MHSYVKQDLHAERDEVLADLTWEACVHMFPLYS